MGNQFLSGEPRPIPLRHDFGECGGARFGSLIVQQSGNGSLNFAGGIARLPHANRESQSLQARQVSDLFHLHSNTHNRPACKRRGHDRAHATMDHGEIGHPIHLERREPVSYEHIRRNSHLRNAGKLELYCSDDAIGFSFEALDEVGDDLGRAGASHGEVDERLVARYVTDLVGQWEFVLEGVKMIGSPEQSPMMCSLVQTPPVRW